MPDSIADLLSSLGGVECPAPAPHPPVPSILLTVDVVPFSGAVWEFGDVMTLGVEPGVMNQAGGGHCWLAEMTIRSGRTGETSLPGRNAPENCVAVSEPPLYLSFPVALVAVLVLVRLRGGGA